ncbi:MAG: phosphodiester glycosidase family protein [Clostridia bacterium]|nr:phosphodiester glycosidase family protein [Clostridia bacterium]
MKKRRMERKTVLAVMISAAMLMTTTCLAFASPSAYDTGVYNGKSVKFVTVDLNDPHMQAKVMTAGNLTQAASVENMAKSNGVFAAVNGTPFSQTEYGVVPEGTIIKDGKLLHIGEKGAVFGITEDGKVVLDRLAIKLRIIINGTEKPQAAPKLMNHPSDDPDDIILFTPEFGKVTVPEGAIAVVVGSTERVEYITAKDFKVPENGFAILFNMTVSDLAAKYYTQGDLVSYGYSFKPVFTEAEQWESVKEAVGAGPSLIIDGKVTADGKAEGYTDSKLVSDLAGRSFIGSTKEGKIIMGCMSSATPEQAAAACKSLGLVNAMCLDGGSSIALYYNGNKGAGRTVSNALGFVDVTGDMGLGPDNYVAPGSVKAIGKKIELSFDCFPEKIQSYNINGNNYFMLRDLAALTKGTAAEFSVDYNAAANAVYIDTDGYYTPTGVEGIYDTTQIVYVPPTESKVYINGVLFESTAYNIDCNNYFKLRDLAKALGFGVDYDEAKELVIIDTKVQLQQEDSDAQNATPAAVTVSGGAVENADENR